jgi:hypothetical protein
MAYPQKLILTLHQRVIFIHRLSILDDMGLDELDELFNDWRKEIGQPPLDCEALQKAVKFFDVMFTSSNGHLIAVCVETEEQAEVLAECLEGGTYFATRTKGDSVYVHAAKAAAELLSTVLDREVEPRIDERTPHNTI